MKFEFEVGQNEKHLISFYFNKFLGNLEIKVDNEQVIKDFRTHSIELTVSYDFTIGVSEVHDIKISKVRPLFFAGFRSNSYQVFVDGKMIKEYKD